MTGAIDQRLVIGFVVVLFAITAYLWFGPSSEGDHGDNSANFPDGTHWICSDAACGHEFHLTIEQLSDHHKEHYGHPVPCEKCNKPATRAEFCKHCERFFVMQRDSTTCPHCGKTNVEAPVSSE